MKHIKDNWYEEKFPPSLTRYRSAMNQKRNDLNFDESVEIKSKEKSEVRIKTPKMYRVILYNDDYTTMDFVIEILVSIFNKPAADATRIMLDVHKCGTGICGVYIRDIAVTKVNQVHQLAKQNQFPLRCGYEEA